MRRNKPSFASDASGLAAVEFAMILPAFAMVLMIISDGAIYLLRNHDMHSAISSAAQYVMQTGTNANLTTAQSIASSAWTSQASGSTVTVSNACVCGSTATSCSVLCSDQSVPMSFTTISATSSYTGVLLGHQALSASEVVRVR